MAVWDWDDVPHQVCAFDGSAHPSARLAASLVPPAPPLGPAYDAWFAERSGHPVLQLCEWSVSDLIPSIFAVLRENGSRFGFVVEQAQGWVPAETYCKVTLDEATAAQIARDSAMDPTMAFADDTGRCVLASWWSDDAWIAMEPDLFAQWLSREPLQMLIDGDWRSFDTFASAKAAANRWKEEYLRAQEEWRNGAPRAPAPCPPPPGPYPGNPGYSAAPGSHAVSVRWSRSARRTGGDS